MVKVFEGTKQEYYLDEYHKINLDTAKNAVKKDFDMLFCYDGAEGCLAGDTQIQISRFKLSRRYSLKRLYNHYNGNPDKINQNHKLFDLKEPSRVRSYNGKDIRLYKIKNVSFSGIKKVYKLELENGLSLKGTLDHRIMTDKGWTELIKLDRDSNVMCDTLHSEKSGRKRIKLYDIQLNVGSNHPYPINGRVEVHRLIYEARLNNLSFLEYLDILLNETKQSKALKFIDTSIFDVHHIDGCHYNNSIENLKLMKKEEHQLEHNEYSNFSQGVPKFSKVKSIKYEGEEETYDIECEGHHNFVANGIVVHNSGKSTKAMQDAFYCDPTLDIDRIVFTPYAFRKAIMTAGKYQAVIYDEAYTGLSSRATMSLINRTLISMLAEIRQRNLFVFVVMPSFFDLDKYVALHRSRALVHVYMGDDFERGYFCFYNIERKKDLYINGKKFYSYFKPQPNFRGRFTKFMIIDDAAYRQKKKESLLDREKKSEESEIKRQVQDETFNRLMETDIGLTHEQKAKILGIPISTYYFQLRKYNERKEFE